MGRPVVHWELMSKDPAKVSAFYEKIFGWKITHMPEMNYRLVETGGQGGINGAHPAEKTLSVVDFADPRSTYEQSRGSAGRARPDAQVRIRNQKETRPCDS